MVSERLNISLGLDSPRAFASFFSTAPFYLESCPPKAPSLSSWRPLYGLSWMVKGSQWRARYPEATLVSTTSPTAASPRLTHKDENSSHEPFSVLLLPLDVVVTLYSVSICCPSARCELICCHSLGFRPSMWLLQDTMWRAAERLARYPLRTTRRREPATAGV